MNSDSFIPEFLHINLQRFGGKRIAGGGAGYFAELACLVLKGNRENRTVQRTEGGGDIDLSEATPGQNQGEALLHGASPVT